MIYDTKEKKKQLSKNSVNLLKYIKWEKKTDERGKSYFEATGATVVALAAGLKSGGRSFSWCGCISLMVCFIVFSAAPQVRPISSAVRSVLLPVKSHAMKMAAAASEFGERDVSFATSFTLLAM